MTKSDRKVMKVIKYNENYIREAELKGQKETYRKSDGFLGFTTLFFIKRNLECYKDMIGKDKRKLPTELKELYYSI
jgi:hypothetical protein